MDQVNQNLFELQLDQPSTAHLGEAAKWAKFLAIMGFIFCGLMIVIALFAGTLIGSAMSAAGGGIASMFGSGIITTFYLVIAGIYFFPCLFLFRFASLMQHAIRDHEQNKLQESLKNLKSCFRFLGIFTIIVLCFYVLGMFGFMMLGLSSL